MINIENFFVKFQYQNYLKIDSLTIPENGIFTITGDNGTGKSTLVKSILHIYYNYEGNIYIDNKLNKYYTRKEIAQKISYLPQNSPIDIDIIVKDYILHGLYASNGNIYDEIIKILDLEKYLDRNFSNLSGGEKQLIRIARSLVSNVKYSFLDEPDSFLSKKNREKFLNLLYFLKDKRSIILISHHDFEEESITNLIHLECE